MIFGHGLQHVLVESPPHCGDPNERRRLERVDRLDEASDRRMLVRPLLLVLREGLDTPGRGHETLFMTRLILRVANDRILVRVRIMSRISLGFRCFRNG